MLGLKLIANSIDTCPSGSLAPNPRAGNNLSLQSVTQWNDSGQETHALTFIVDLTDGNHRKEWTIKYVSTRYSQKRMKC